MEIQSLNSVLGLSVGIHLAYTMILDFHFFHFRKSEKKYDLYKKFCDQSKSATELQGLPGILWAFEMSLLLRRSIIEKRVVFAQIISGLVAVISSLIIAMAAFFPKYEIGTFIAVTLVCLLCLPVPVIFAFSYISNNKWRREIKETTDLVQWKYSDAYKKDMENS